MGLYEGECSRFQRGKFEVDQFSISDLNLVMDIQFIINGARIC